MNLTTMLDYSLVTQAKEQELKLLIRLKAPVGSARKRKPLNLGVVIDRSGSMQGDKIENVKRAIKTLITHLGSDDYLTLVQFDDDVQVLLEPSPVKDKDALKALVDRIEVGGSTNLSGGWLEGIKQIGKKAGPDYISRCLLLTDGDANVGIQDPRQLAALGGDARQKLNIVTTTLGFGEGFNEDLLTAIAKESGGAFYFVENADQAPTIFNEELQGLLKLVAQNISVTLVPESPVKMVAQWTDYPAVRKPTSLTFSLGDAYAEEEKNLLVSMLIPGLQDMGPATVAKVTVEFSEIGETGLTARVITQEVRVNVTDEQTAGASSPDIQVSQQYGLQFAAKARKEAIAEADGGDYKKAQKTLRKAAETIAKLPDPDGMLKEEVKDLEQQTQQLDQENYTRTRKVMSETMYSLSTADYQRNRAARERRTAGARYHPGIKADQQDGDGDWTQNQGHQVRGNYAKLGTEPAEHIWPACGYRPLCGRGINHDPVNPQARAASGPGGQGEAGGG